MTSQELIYQIIAGGLLGMLGQTVRAVAGMKQLHDSASASGQSFSDLFSASRMLTSILIGFAAGALALLGASAATTNFKLDNSSIMTIIAAGYAGTDFIEAFMSKALPGSGAAQTSAAPPSQPPAMG